MSHTPGPWKTLPNEEFEWSGVADSTGHPLASCLNADRKANAHLIAAAPEMLAALKEEVDCAREFDSSSSAYQRAQESLENIKAIIAKAEGRETE